MRKWMSERLKRRKKPGDGATKEATTKEATNKEATNKPEPLQPRFYDNDPSEPPQASVEASAPVVESRRASKPESEPAFEPASAPAALSATVESRPRTSRRRRSRGGRGGSRQRSGSVAATPAPEGVADSSGAGSSAPETAIVEQSPVKALPAQAVSARPSKGTVVLAIGLPGSGKSSWFKRHNIHPLSSDLLRELLFDDAQEQRFQDLVFSNLRSMLKARLIARRPMNYVDATNLTPHDRNSWIKLAKDYGYDVQGLFFDVPLEVCMERHQRRGRAVPEEIMQKMAGKLKPPTFEEGFSKITVVRVKQKEATAGS
jgi:predicted kinase